MFCSVTPAYPLFYLAELFLALLFFVWKSFFSAPLSAWRIPSPPPAPAPATPPAPTTSPRCAGHRRDHQSASRPQTPAPSNLPGPPCRIAGAAISSRTPPLQSFLF